MSPLLASTSRLRDAWRLETGFATPGSGYLGYPPGSGPLPPGPLTGASVPELAGPSGGVGGAVEAGCALVFTPGTAAYTACVLAGRQLLGGGGSEPPTADSGSPGLVDTGQGQCPPGELSVMGRCVDPGAALPGGEPFVTNSPVRGLYGVGFTPMVDERVHRSCPKGYVLGDDNVCYRRGEIRRRERKWVPGRKPLLTGGDLNAIARAARAAGRLERQQKRLQKLGLMKKPTRSSRSRSSSSSSSSDRPDVVVVKTD